MQVYNAQINPDVFAQVVLLILLIRNNVNLVQILNGGNFGQRKRTAVMQGPNYRMVVFSLEENLIQAVTIIILPHIGEKA